MSGVQAGSGSCGGQVPGGSVGEFSDRVQSPGLVTRGLWSGFNE